MSPAQGLLLALLLSGRLGAAEPAAETAPVKPAASTPAAGTPAPPIDRPRPVELRRADLLALAAQAGARARWLDGPQGRFLALVDPGTAQPARGRMLLLAEPGLPPGGPALLAPLARELNALGWETWQLAGEAVPSQAQPADGPEAEAEAGLRLAVDAALAAPDGERGRTLLVLHGQSAAWLLAKPDTQPALAGLISLDAPMASLPRPRLPLLDVLAVADGDVAAARRLTGQDPARYRQLRLAGTDHAFTGFHGFLARALDAWGRRLLSPRPAAGG